MIPALALCFFLVQTPPAPQTPPAEPADVPEVKQEVTVSATRSHRRLQDEPLRVEVMHRSRDFH